MVSDFRKFYIYMLRLHNDCFHLITLSQYVKKHYVTIICTKCLVLWCVILQTNVHCQSNARQRQDVTQDEISLDTVDDLWWCSRALTLTLGTAEGSCILCIFYGLAQFVNVVHRARKFLNANAKIQRCYWFIAT